MTTVVVTHEVKNGEHWGRRPGTKGPAAGMSWWPSPEARLAIFVIRRIPNLVGLIFEVPDVQALATYLQSAEAAKAMAEDGVKPETVRMVVEFTP